MQHIMHYRLNNISQLRSIAVANSICDTSIVTRTKEQFISTSTSIAPISISRHLSSASSSLLSSTSLLASNKHPYFSLKSRSQALPRHMHAASNVPTPIPMLKRPTVSTSVFLLCDIQDTFRDKMYQWQSMMQASVFLTKVASQLSIPIIVTEQIPFKPTLEELSSSYTDSLHHLHKKTVFSMLTPEVRAQLEGYKKQGREFIYLYGIESHICVMQTTLYLLREGYNVRLPIDAVTSMQKVDFDAALGRYQALSTSSSILSQQTSSSGVLTLTSAESAIFELIGDAANPQFKSPVFPLVKQFSAIKSQTLGKL